MYYKIMLVTMSIITNFRKVQSYFFNIHTIIGYKNNVRKVAVKFSLTIPIAHNNLLHANIENKTACNTLDRRTLLQAVFLFVFSYVNLSGFIICIFGNHVSIVRKKSNYGSVDSVKIYTTLPVLALSAAT